MITLVMIQTEPMATSVLRETRSAEARQALASAEDAEGLAEAALALLRDGEARRRAAESGRNYARAHLSWECMGAAWDRLLEEVIAGAARVGAGR